ncbi:hypothetical protein BKA62DRAFT_675198 [Auriculariales sp. MPI-PUGE-AT-0066]|nr:hypothetical protein BKA62DRAFT_675198 [Auriculariales sp. MPI-PUGE-AT-0066]
MCLGVTEVFRGFGGNPEVVGLHPKDQSVQCAIEAHRARGWGVSESRTEVSGEDSQSFDIGEAKVSGSARRVSMEHVYGEMGTWDETKPAGSTGVWAMMAGAQPEGPAIYQVKVQCLRGVERPGQELDTYRSMQGTLEKTGELVGFHLVTVPSASASNSDFGHRPNMHLHPTALSMPLTSPRIRLHVKAKHKRTVSGPSARGHEGLLEGNVLFERRKGIV